MAPRIPRTAPDIHDNRDNRAMSILDVSSNNICGIDKYGYGTYDSSGLAALVKSISKLKELNISNNCLKAEGAAILAQALDEDNGALSKFTFSGDSGSSTPVTVEVGMTKLDCHGKQLGASGAMILVTWLQHK